MQAQDVGSAGWMIHDAGPRRSGPAGPGPGRGGTLPGTVRQSPRRHAGPGQLVAGGHRDRDRDWPGPGTMSPAGANGRGAGGAGTPGPPAGTNCRSDSDPAPWPIQVKPAVRLGRSLATVTASRSHRGTVCSPGRRRQRVDAGLTGYRSHVASCQIETGQWLATRRRACDRAMTVPPGQSRSLTAYRELQGPWAVP